jgi:hypothetical protein
VTFYSVEQPFNLLLGEIRPTGTTEEVEKNGSNGRSSPDIFSPASPYLILTWT